MDKYLDELLSSIEREESQDESPRTALIRCWRNAEQKIMESLQPQYQEMIRDEMARIQAARERGERIEPSKLLRHLGELVIFSWDGLIQGPRLDAVLTIDEETCVRLSNMHKDGNIA